MDTFPFASVLANRKFSFFIIIRILFHYDCEADNLADASEILCHANVEKEHFLCQLNSVTLGKIVSDIWGEKVKWVQRRPRTQRKAFYQNHKIKELIASQTLPEANSIGRSKQWPLGRFDLRGPVVLKQFIDDD